MADDDGGAGVAVQNIPALGLAQAAVFVDLGVGVVGVDLGAQVVPGVDDLNEQGLDAAGEVSKELRLLGP